MVKNVYNNNIYVHFRHFEAQEAKSLRVGVNTFFDHLGLVVKTIDQFGPPKTDEHIGDGDKLS